MTKRPGEATGKRASRAGLLNQSGTRVVTKLVIPSNLKPLQSGIFRVRISVVEKASCGGSPDKRCYVVEIREMINRI